MTRYRVHPNSREDTPGNFHVAGENKRTGYYEPEAHAVKRGTWKLKRHAQAEADRLNGIVRSLSAHPMKKGMKKRFQALPSPVENTNRPLVWGFVMPHPVGSICGRGCIHCGRPCLSFNQYGEIIPPESMPALLITGIATREDWRESNIARGGSALSGDYPYYYFVSTD
jgi:hypothetical protein